MREKIRVRILLKIENRIRGKFKARGVSKYLNRFDKEGSGTYSLAIDKYKREKKTLEVHHL